MLKMCAYGANINCEYVHDVVCNDLHNILSDSLRTQRPSPPLPMNIRSGVYRNCVNVDYDKWKCAITIKVYCMNVRF